MGRHYHAGVVNVIGTGDASETVGSILWLEVDSLCAYAAIGLPMPNDEYSEPFLDVLTVAPAVLG
jgi:hypothetical protein